MEIHSNFYKYKYYLFNDFVEEVSYRNGVFSLLQSKKPVSRCFTRTQKEKDRSKFNSISRSKKNIRHIVKANISQNNLFVTLTTRENITDYNKSAEQFRKFIQHLKRKGYYYPYIATREKQKRGAIHYHIIFFGCKFIPYDDVLDYWAKKFDGNVDFASVYNSSSVKYITWYIVKYIKKDIDGVSFKKRYLTNKIIKRPLIVKTNIPYDLTNYRLTWFSDVINDTGKELSFKHFTKNTDLL